MTAAATAAARVEIVFSFSSPKIEDWMHLFPPPDAETATFSICFLRVEANRTSISPTNYKLLGKLLF